jgi:hypothetical protein
MAQSRMHQQPEGYPLSIATQTFPAQRDIPTPANHHEPELAHDHAWRQVDDADQPLLIGMYRCDLCHVEWAL